LITTRWSLINPTCSICNIGEIVKYKCSKNERLISRNEKNKKNNVINGNEEVEEEKLDNGFKVEELDNGKKESNKGDNEKRLIITNILGVFLIAFTIWKIISM
jgi:hypothetical protein